MRVATPTQSGMEEQLQGMLRGPRQERSTAATGLEERSQPVIGALPALTAEQQYLRSLLTGDGPQTDQAYRDIAVELSEILGRIDRETTQRAAGAPSSRALYAEFDKKFGELLAVTQGDMPLLASIFDSSIASMGSSAREQVLNAVRHLAQDPGAPYNQPPVSYYNPARFLYARLQQEAVAEIADRILGPTLSEIAEVIGATDLSNIGQKVALVRELRDQLGTGRQSAGAYSYEIFYDSLVEKDGERYLTVQVILDGAQDVAHGVVLELMVVVPAAGTAAQYRQPFDLGTDGTGYSVGLLDPLHFIHQRFPEWGPVAQRDVYDARLKVRKETGVKRQIVRPSVRQGNNPRFFEPFVRACLIDDVPFLEHIVHTRSEREYGNQTGVTAVANLAMAMVMRGGLGVTASWILEAPRGSDERRQLEQMAAEGRQLIYTHEIDHHRVDNTRSVAEFAAEFEYLLAAYKEVLATGFVSANLQDETKFIVETVRQRLLDLVKSGDGTITPENFQLLQGTYNDNAAPVTAGLPSSLGANFLRNIFLKPVMNTVGVAAGGIPYEQLYVEPDYALDGKPNTVEEMAYLGLMSWIHAQIHGYKLSPLVPSYGNVHGASAGDPSLELAGVLQYAAQAATIYGAPLSADLLAIARKAPQGSIAQMRTVTALFQDQALAQEYMGLLEAAGERTEAEEQRLAEFELAQLQKIPAEIMQGLKAAERAGKSLAAVVPDVAQELEDRLQALPLERWAAITTHAASGLSAEQLAKARESGIWVANKSTEWQNVITKILHVVYLMQTNPEAGQRELARLPGAQRVWTAQPLTGQALQDAADLYARLYDAAADRAKKTPEEGRPFFWTWQEGLGWSQVDPATGQERKDLEWATGPHGRYMFSMRDNDGVLRFPNALGWLPNPIVVAMASAEIERSVQFYHQPSVMNAPGAGQEYRDYMAAKAGLEEVEKVVAQLDAASAQDRLAALDQLLTWERAGRELPSAEPALPSYIHVHTTASYPGVRGVVSPTHLIWAAHRAGATRVGIVDHEAYDQISETEAAAKLVNAQRERLGQEPLRLAHGIEFKAPVDFDALTPEEAQVLRVALGESNRGDAMWVVGMGARVNTDIEALVRQFQQAKRNRAEGVIAKVNEALSLSLKLSDVQGSDGNVTDRQIAYAAAQAVLGADASDAALTAKTLEIRQQYIVPIPYAREFGFPSYQELVRELARLGMIPAFTTQVSVGRLSEPMILALLKKIGIEALDVAGVKPGSEGGNDDTGNAQALGVIRLARDKGFLVFGGSDYRGIGTGWLQAASWMAEPQLDVAFQEAAGRAGTAQLRDEAVAAQDAWSRVVTLATVPSPTHYVLADAGVAAAPAFQAASSDRFDVVVRTPGEARALLSLNIQPSWIIGITEGDVTEELYAQVDPEIRTLPGDSLVDGIGAAIARLYSNLGQTLAQPVTVLTNLPGLFGEGIVAGAVLDQFTAAVRATEAYLESMK